MYLFDYARRSEVVLRVERIEKTSGELTFGPNETTFWSTLSWVKRFLVGAKQLLV